MSDIQQPEEKFDALGLNSLAVILSHTHSDIK